MQCKEIVYVNGISKCKSLHPPNLSSFFFTLAVLIVLTFRFPFSLDWHAQLTYLIIFVLFLGSGTALLKVNLLTLPLTFETHNV